jgi:hypothetical protein
MTYPNAKIILDASLKHLPMNGLHINGQDPVSQPLLTDDYQMNMVLICQAISALIIIPQKTGIRVLATRNSPKAGPI